MYPFLSIFFALLLSSTQSAHAHDPGCPEPSMVPDFTLTVTSIIEAADFGMTIGVFIAISSLIVIFRHWIERIARFLQRLPEEAYEYTCYAFSAIIILSGTQSADVVVAEIIATVGMILFVFALSMTDIRLKSRYNETIIITMYGVSTALTLLFSSYMIGAMAILSLLVLIEKILLRIRNSYMVVRYTASGCTLLGIFAVSRVLAQEQSGFDYFEPWLLLFGVMVIGIGFAILSSRVYFEELSKYIAMQVTTVGLCVAAAIAGSYFEISTMQRLGGGFLLIYPFLKILDIRPKTVLEGAYLGLTFAVLTLIISWYIKTNIDTISSYLLL